MYPNKLLCVALSAALCACASDTRNLLQQIRTQAVRQLQKSANYTCIETIDRSYLESTSPNLHACQAEAPMNMHQYMHDRLRLNVAVSQNSEIFGWHGSSSLSSHDIDRVVQGGPVSSGSFVGFIDNIFQTPGVEFTYKGRARQDRVNVVEFNYHVPQAISRFRIEGNNSAQSVVVGFHGSFSAGQSNFQLVRLRIVADKIPAGFGICATDNQVRYQLASISGAETLIPRTFELHTQDETNVETISRSEYSQCHEYRAESTLRFNDPAQPAAAPVQRGPETWLPAGLDLHLTLTGTVDERQAFTGDPVEATLTEAALDPSGRVVIPQNARLRGVITQLETFYDPEKHQSLRLEFNHASFNGRDYALRALHKPAPKDFHLAAELFDGGLPDWAKSEIEHGTVFFQGFYLRLDRKYHGEWQTLPRPVPTP